MSNPLPAAVKARMQAIGGLAPVSLLEIATVGGNFYYWSDAHISVVSVLGPPQYLGVDALPYNAGTPVQNQGPQIGQVFLPWILTPPSFTSYKSTQTSTGSVVIQNVTGNTIYRETALMLSTTELINATVFYRLWSVECEYALFSFQGSIDGVDIDADGDSMTLNLESWCNWSKIKAPYKQTGVSCPLTFGSVECGSTASGPCNNDYGTCSSINRFQGIILEWNGASLDYSQYVQPEPLRLVNNRIAG